DWGRELEARVLADQHARRGERVEPEETGGGHERQRDEEETRIAPAARGQSDRVAERNVQRSGGQDDPEVCGVVLPGAVERRPREDGDEDSRAGDDRQPWPDPARVAGPRLNGFDRGFGHRPSANPKPKRRQACLWPGESVSAVCVRPLPCGDEAVAAAAARVARGAGDRRRRGGARGRSERGRGRAGSEPWAGAPPAARGAAGGPRLVVRQRRRADRI